MTGRLTTEQADFFRKQGYLSIDEPVLSEDSFAALRVHFEELLDRWTGAGGSPEHMDVPHFEHPSLFRWLFDDGVLDIVESVIGPDIALWSSHFISKPAREGKRVPWHEDSAYWGAVLDPMEVVTVWLAIDPSTAANGCMRVIPGSHVNGYSNYEAVADPSKEVFSREIVASDFDESQAVDLVLRPNTCSLHDAKLIHGSHANQGVDRRCGYTMRYMPTHVKFQPQVREGRQAAHQVYLARGKDHAGNTYGDPSKVNEAWMAFG